MHGTAGFGVGTLGGAAPRTPTNGSAGPLGRSTASAVPTSPLLGACSVKQRREAGSGFGLEEGAFHSAPRKGSTSDWGSLRASTVPVGIGFRSDVARDGIPAASGTSRPVRSENGSAGIRGPSTANDVPLSTATGGRPSVAALAIARAAVATCDSPAPRSPASRCFAWARSRRKSRSRVGSRSNSRCQRASSASRSWAIRYRSVAAPDPGHALQDQSGHGWKRRRRAQGPRSTWIARRGVRPRRR